jgi:hypothetical protein
MANFGLVRRIPGMAKLISTLMKKLLDFSDYKYQKLLINNNNVVQDFELAMRLESDRILTYLKTLGKYIFEHKASDSDQLVLIGNSLDGSYVTTSESILSKKWVAIGIGSHFQFEEELAKQGNSVYGFDLNITKKIRLNRRIKLIKKNWGDMDSSSSITLGSILQVAGISNSDEWNLKFDIEGSEWRLINQIFTQSNLPQIIVGEFHELIPRFNDFNLNNRLDLIKQLHEHYNPVFVKANNYSAYVATADLGLYDALEITWILKTHDISSSPAKPMSTSHLTIINDKLKPMYPIGYLLRK